MDIGLIAGGGQFPKLFCQKAAQNGFRVHAVGFKSETEPELAELTESIEWLYLGQVTRLLKYFKKHNVSKAVLMGTINKTQLFKDIRPDLKALSFIARNIRTHDDSVLRAFAEMLGSYGIEIIDSTFLMPELISPHGVWTKKKPDKAQVKDIKFGWHIAGEIGKLDIGQCVVVGNGSILAVEAVEGTDQAILRGGALSRKSSAVVVKRCKPNQDFRFDLPASGTQTIETMHKAGADVLVVESGRSLSFDREEMIARADQLKICIFAASDEDFL